MLYNSIHKDKIISADKGLQNIILSNLLRHGILIVTVNALQVDINIFILKSAGHTTGNNVGV
jgi:hypothetical protein